MKTTGVNLFRMNADASIKKARHMVGGEGVSKMKTAHRRKSRHVENQRLRVMGEDYFADSPRLTSWDIS